KHDSFLTTCPKVGSFSFRFTGKELMFGEPDASSFPSGGLRSTHEARGYTAWDPASSPFLWESVEGVTLIIPAVFYSWKGIALDHKIPLLRSTQKIETAVLRLLALCQIEATSVAVTLGIEQEYFLIDQGLFQLRPDLVLTGRTLFGAKPPKGQELEDHYCGAVQPHALAFMRDFEESALRLGIPVKTRHNEVAPRQYEVAPIFESASLACDHNLLLMEVMRQTAANHGLACLFHEKPFAGLNGSGKHNNWSLATDTGMNILDPKGNSFVFLTVLAAVLRGVHEHAGLLRASIGSASNDYRLGGSEAPPSILSIYLGEALEQLVHDIIQEKPAGSFPIRNIDLGLEHMSLHAADPTDRNRTSFFVFTGNKFEFRAVGASAACAFPVAVLNSIVADSLQLILDEMVGVGVKSEKASLQDCLQTALPVLRKHFRAALPVLFGGNNYSQEWHAESVERGLPNFTSSFHAFHVLQDKKSIRVLEDVLNEKEIESRYEILVEQYAKTMNIEINLMLELFATQIVPSVQKDLRKRFSLLQSASALGVKSDAQMQIAQQMSRLLDEAIGVFEEIRLNQTQAKEFGWEAKAKVFCELIRPKMQHLRTIVDALELQTDHNFWPLVKIRELLF
ncbi:MAG TPA: glutamine synthetase III, partial [Chlamydiales bacterium]|nr:glutamine synthetase III [Chlamydiales bacterium]